MTSLSADGGLVGVSASATDQTPSVTGQAPSDKGTGAADEAIAPTRARPLALAILGGVVLAGLALDLLTKQLALAHLTNAEPVRLLGGALYLNLTRNPGAAFSIGTDYTFIFPIIAVVVLVGIGWLARQLRSVPWAVSMGLIAGGAMGNLVDRIFRAPAPMHGHVVDFLSLFDPAGQVWPIFNIADSVLFCGVAIAILLELTGRRRDGSRELGKETSGGDGEARQS